MESAALAFGLVFVAELGDKSQLVALSLSARHRTGLVAAAIVAASALTQGLSVAAGGLLGAVVEGRWVTLAAGLLFLGFAVMTLRDADDEEDDHVAGTAGRRGAVAVVAAIAVGIVLAEFGDKTMLMTMSLAAREGVVATWIGATAGMSLAGLLAIGVGGALARFLSPTIVRLGSAALFAVFGVILLVEALSG